MNRNRSLAVLPAIAAIGMLVAGCGGSDSSGHAAPTDHSTMDMSTMSPSPSPSPSPSASAQDSGTASSSSKLVVTIKDFAYSGPSSVPAGSKVTVMNEDSVAHTLTADSTGGFDVTIAPGKSATFTAPAKAGSYAYHCTYHANMHGTLKVS